MYFIYSMTLPFNNFTLLHQTSNHFQDFILNLNKLIPNLAF